MESERKIAIIGSDAGGTMTDMFFIDQNADFVVDKASITAKKVYEVGRYHCPGCGAQLEVESVPYGHPILFEFLPDLDAFHGGCLGGPLTTKKEFTDLKYELQDRSGQRSELFWKECERE